MTTGPETPAAELNITVELVRSLLEEQHSDLAHLPIVPLDSGWDNILFRLGEQLLIRLPRRAVASTLIVNEQKWLPFLSQDLPISVSLPVRIRFANPDYPWRWSILPWLEGTTADLDLPDRSQAEILVKFLNHLHVDAPHNAPENSFRGVDLSERAVNGLERIDRLSAKTDLVTTTIIDIWERALAAPPATDRKWLHGDLHPRNVLVKRGKITGIIDWGDITSGDVATDLAALWMLIDDDKSRSAAIQQYRDQSEATWLRARGWAALFGFILLDTGLVDHPRHAVMGERILTRLDREPSS